MDILVAAGSWRDPVQKQGLAHFLEHMMFRGTKKRGYRQISLDTLKIGGYLNAFTERDATTYTLDVPYRQTQQALDILLDLFLESTFPEDGVEKERTIILEEIDMYNDIPTEYLMDRFMENLFEGHCLGIPILGTKESVNTITREDIIHFYEQWYYDASLTISIAGRVEPQEILPILEERLGKREVRKNRTFLPTNISNKKHTARYQREVDQGQLIMGVVAPGLEDPDRLAIQVMNAILGGNEISRLYQIIREDQGLAYAVDTAHDAWLGAGCFYVSVGLDSRKIDQVEKIILQEWERMKAELVSDEELLVAKNSLEGSKIMELEGAGAYSSHIGAMTVRGLPADPEVELEMLQKVTASDVMRIARKVLDTENYVLTALLPKRSTRRSCQ